MYSAVPGEGTYTSYGDELKLQGVAGCVKATRVFLEDRHSQRHWNGFKTEIIIKSPTGVVSVANGLMDDLWHTVHVDILPDEKCQRRDFSQSLVNVQL